MGNPSRRNTPSRVDWDSVSQFYSLLSDVSTQIVVPSQGTGVTFHSEQRLGQRLTFSFSVSQCFGLIKWSVPCSTLSSIYIRPFK